MMVYIMAAVIASYAAICGYAWFKWQRFIRLCESPIEVKLWDALSRSIMFASYDGSVLRGWHKWARIEIRQQTKPIPNRQYRPDFIATYKGRQYCIEADGAAYHGSSTAQISDANRDQVFFSHGILTFRYKGAEINRNAIECATRALRMISLKP